MASPEENMQAALDRAAKFREAGNLERAAVWEASADRYRRIIEAKQKIATAAQNVEAIKQKIEQSKQSSGEVTSGPNKGWYQTVTSRPSATCPSGHERVRITYMDGVETGAESLGCHGGERVSEDRTRNSGEPTQPVVAATPPTPTSIPVPPPPPVKTAPIDTILFNDDDFPIEIMTDLIFENIGGQEIINIVRNDTVNGQNIIYQPIKNMSLIQKQYNPNNIIALQSTSASYFANFSIKLENKIPNVGNGVNGENVYLDVLNGDIVVEVVNLESDEEVEIEFVVNGTIYEAEI